MTCINHFSFVYTLIKTLSATQPKCLCVAASSPDRDLDGADEIEKDDRDDYKTKDGNKKKKERKKENKGKN